MHTCIHTYMHAYLHTCILACSLLSDFSQTPSNSPWPCGWWSYPAQGLKGLGLGTVPQAWEEMPWKHKGQNLVERFCDIFVGFCFVIHIYIYGIQIQLQHFRCSFKGGVIMKLVGIAEEQSQNRVPLVFPVISGQYVEIGNSMKMMYDMYDMYDIVWYCMIWYVMADDWMR